MNRIILFVIFSIPLIAISWRNLFSVKSHGFYRFFSWECIVWLAATNYRYWFDDPFSYRQIFSWVLLLIALYLVTAGVILIKHTGKPSESRNEKTLYHFEQTTELIDKGIFKYIRHPLYSSLLFLAWGIFLKNPTLELFIVTILSTGFLVITAILDEKECMAYFGVRYVEYMKRSKRFIPFLI
ncbi:MAG: hypothetical protein JXA61_02975 [Bacteroidales bacterium]|nr:hypothetical protein [Bacteroidales bacterium]